jgi:hypothetical protein
VGARAVRNSDIASIITHSSWLAHLALVLGVEREWTSKLRSSPAPYFAVQRGKRVKKRREPWPPLGDPVAMLRRARPRLPSGALPADAPDPLKYTCPDVFWWEVDAHFAPIPRESATALWDLDASAATAPSPDVPDPAPGQSTPQLDRMRAYPLTHRLVAALLDEGRVATPAPRPGPRPPPALEPLWLPQLPNVQAYYDMLEQRVSAELRSAGLLARQDPAHDELATSMANKHFRLSNLVSANESSHLVLLQRTASEIARQDERRVHKRRQDGVEIECLETMVRNAPKKQRSKYKKLLSTRFPDRSTLGQSVTTWNPPTPPSSVSKLLTNDGAGDHAAPLQGQTALDDIRRKKKRKLAHSALRINPSPDVPVGLLPDAR